MKTILLSLAFLTLVGCSKDDPCTYLTSYEIIKDERGTTHTYRLHNDVAGPTLAESARPNLYEYDVCY